MSEWLPIESAPHSEDIPVLLWDGLDISIGERQYTGSTVWYCCAGGKLAQNGGEMVDLISVHPTHWQPLPTPPNPLQSPLPGDIV